MSTTPVASVATTQKPADVPLRKPQGYTRAVPLSAEVRETVSFGETNSILKLKIHEGKKFEWEEAVSSIMGMNGTEGSTFFMCFAEEGEN